MNYVTAEMKNPSRDLSRVIHSAVPIVISIHQDFRAHDVVSYLAANIGYFAVLPMNIITSSETIALVTPLLSANLTARTLDPLFLDLQGALSSPSACS